MVDDVSFCLNAGDKLGLVGESGCGKSTLSRTILRLLRPTLGSIQFLGQELSYLSPEQMRPKRRQIQLIFQDPYACLNPMMTVGENMIDSLFIHPLATAKEGKKQGMQILEKVRLIPLKSIIIATHKIYQEDNSNKSPLLER